MVVIVALVVVAFFSRCQKGNRFKKGDKVWVHVPWDRGAGLYYHGTIRTFDKDTRNYTVDFDDGTWDDQFTEKEVYGEVEGAIKKNEVEHENQRIEDLYVIQLCLRNWQKDPTNKESIGALQTQGPIVEQLKPFKDTEGKDIDYQYIEHYVRVNIEELRGFYKYTKVDWYDEEKQRKNTARIDERGEMNRIQKDCIEFCNLFKAVNDWASTLWNMEILLFDFLKQGHQTSNIYTYHTDTEASENLKKETPRIVCRTLIVKINQGASTSVEVAGQGVTKYGYDRGSVVHFRAAAAHRSVAAAANLTSIKIVFFLGYSATTM